MESLIKKTKSLSIITLIFAVLSLTWLFLDYLALRKIWEQNPDAFQFEWLMVLVSAAPFVILILLVFALIFYIFRINMRYKSEKKREQKLIAQQENDSSANIKAENK